MSKIIKNSHKGLLRLWSLIVSGVLGLTSIFTGINTISCNGITLEYGVPWACEYGVPYAEYRLHGKIKDASSDIGIQGISIQISEKYLPNIVSTDSDQSGDYEINFNVQDVNGEIKIRLQDIDDSINGTFINKDITVDISESDLSRDCDTDSNWCIGKAVKNLDATMDSE